MRNTYNIGLLRRRIHESMPRALTPFGESAIEGFLSLPGASAWRPDRLGLKELSYIFDIGVPFALIGDNPSGRALGLHVGDAVRDGRPPEARLLSVVHAAALLSRWGLQVEITSSATAALPQFQVRLPNGETMSLEVRRGSDHDPSVRARLLAIDMQGASARYEEVAAYCEERFPESEGVAGVLLFEPRFWIGIEQKEWLHMARLNPITKGLESAMLGNPDGNRLAGRQALRLPLLV